MTSPHLRFRISPPSDSPPSLEAARPQHRSRCTPSTVPVPHALVFLLLTACIEPSESAPNARSVDLHQPCWEDTDCREDLHHCRNGLCEVLEVQDSAPASPHRDAAFGAGLQNLCGGRDRLDGVPGSPCATGCDLGIPVWQCGEGNEHVFCGFSSEHAHLNRCGGTACLLADDQPIGDDPVVIAAPGDPCGECGRYACDGLDALRCIPVGINACGGCAPLALPEGISAPLIEPGEPCGRDPTELCGHLECNGVDLHCMDDAGFNECGRCPATPNERLELTGGDPIDEEDPAVAGPCRTHDGRDGKWQCLPDGRALECVANQDRWNMCGGIAALEGQPGLPCGLCGYIWQCDGEDSVQCVEPANPVQTCTCEEEFAGLPCRLEDDQCCLRNDNWIEGCRADNHVQECTADGTPICATTPGGSIYEDLDRSLSIRCGPDCLDCTVLLPDTPHGQPVCRGDRCGLLCDPGACHVIEGEDERCERRVELCGNGIDDDCDNAIDEPPESPLCNSCDGDLPLQPRCEPDTGGWSCAPCHLPEDAGAPPLPEGHPQP